MFIGLLIYKGEVKGESENPDLANALKQNAECSHFLIQVFLKKLEDIGDKTYIVTCLSRQPSLNEKVGGVHNSKHLKNPVEAVDIAYFDLTTEEGKQLKKQLTGLLSKKSRLEQIKSGLPKSDQLEKTNEKIEEIQKEIEELEKDIDEIVKKQNEEYKKELIKAVEQVFDTDTGLKLKFVDEGKKVLNGVPMPHFHIEVTSMGSSAKKK